MHSTASELIRALEDYSAFIIIKKEKGQTKANRGYIPNMTIRGPSEKGGASAELPVERR